MYPGDGSPQRSFVGLDDPPALTPNTPGRAFTLRTDDLGSLNAGSPISYRGVPVGEIEGFQLDPSGKQIDLYAFVRSPYEKYVTAQTRFWNSGGIDVAVGAQGLRFRASSVQQLISGGVSFDTPDAALHDTESVAGTPYRLYSNQYDAQRDPRGNKLVYRVEFEGGASEVGPGTSVQLQGAEVGQVTQARLQFDDARQSLITRVTLELDPSRIEIVHERRKQSGGATPSAGRAAVATAPVATAAADVTVASAAALDERLRKLVARGLRARLVAANLLTGGKVVSLDLVHDAPPARIEQVEGFAEIPSSSATDISSVLATVQSVLRHLDTVTGGPELGHAVKELDRTLTNLDRVSAELEPQIKPLMAALRETADATQHTLQAANNVLGTSAASGADVPRLLRELTEAARSLRELTDYLSRHPESLIRGRKAEPP
jgi:paraquat-inducible protein B